VRSPFVVRYHTTFIADPNIIVCMELCEGGDLNIHLELLGSFSPGDSKFYMAEICLGLAALHAQNIIYHDLKPQNMMLSKSGHVRLIDFGLASVKPPGGRNSCTDMCGAPSYMSPEMFAGLGHDEMTDWWAVGITYYEFLTGDRPFCGSTFDGLGQSVCSEEVSWDPNIARETKDFIGKLLCKDPGNRMGARGGIDAIKKHPNFASLKWDDIKSCRKPGPKRTEKASLKGTGGASMSRMDQAMMAARGGKQKGGHERRFTISESSKPTNHTPDPSKKGNISGVSREQAFADARNRAAKRKSAQF